MRLVLALLATLMACGPQEPQNVDCLGACPPSPLVALRILTVAPTEVYFDGSQEVAVELEHGCALDALTVTVDGVPVEDVSLGTWGAVMLRPPPRPARETPEHLPLKFVCTHPQELLKVYSAGKNEAVATLTYDLAAEPAPRTLAHTPEGPGIPVDAKMQVTFSRAIDPASVVSTSFGIVGVPGAITADPDGRTFTFTPTDPLTPGTAYECFVTTDVKTLIAGTALGLSFVPDDVSDPRGDLWRFTTVE